MEKLCKIRDVYRAIADYEVQLQQTYNLSLNEGMLLCTLHKTDNLTSGELAGYLGLTTSNTSKVILSLEKKAFVKRVMSKEDKRMMHFSLTAKGSKQLEKIKSSKLELPGLLEGLCSIL